MSSLWYRNEVVQGPAMLAVGAVCVVLTHFYLETRKRVIGKQCKPSSDAT